ncbi:hypothetical protein FDECE_5842 [Fusarium decemcellulare]|nr:hypothetical protein FDECE_5842 [Fusarium decemcellulare]
MFRWLFGRSDARRNTDEAHHKKQYFTSRGSIPTKVVDVQTADVVDPRRPQVAGGYPHRFRNQEEANGKRPFQGYETRNDADRQLYEVPVGSRVDLTRRTATARQVERANNQTHPNDRGRVQRNELNDPGPLRAVLPGNQNTGQTFPVAGVLYHPENNPRGFARAPLEPLDRQGRQYLRRFEDDSAHDERVTTWPPRDEDADDLTAYETRYRQERRPRNRPQPRR